MSAGAKHVVVTGASSGIGFSACKRLIASGFQVFGSVRTEADGGRLAGELGERFAPLLFDVTDGEAIQSAAELVAQQVGDHGLAGLVNNAGIAVSGPLMHLPIEKFQQQLDVNLTGVLRVTQAFLPLLGARSDPAAAPGRIINISSVSGRFAAPFIGAYAASKYGLEALSDSLRRELSLYGIQVVIIEPGRIRTPIWGKVDDMSEYEATDYAPVLRRMLARMKERMPGALPVEVVSDTIHRALTAKQPKLRYPLPDQPLRGWWLPRLLPDRWLDRLIAKQLFKD